MTEGAIIPRIEIEGVPDSGKEDQLVRNARLRQSLRQLRGLAMKHRGVREPVHNEHRRNPRGDMGDG